MTAVDWSRYRKCDVCKAELGKPCRTQSGTLPGGRPVVTGQVDRDRPHSRRKLRSGAVA